ncbi:hypothetical protein WR25_12338 [Diploscapter pachys]|uniref:Uncharacterized protein n=1 Tax=Diploscapter pachys TaxID=2018661 RepID=A0A2A2LB03_9BILA|nr:hypothetical protein WR25_12338 [Diploscapter pachys]
MIRAPDDWDDVPDDELEFGLACNTAWIVATSSLIMFLPYIIEKERSDMERSQKQEQSSEEKRIAERQAKIQNVRARTLAVQKDKNKVAVETEWDTRAKQMIERVRQGQFEADTHEDVEQNGNNSLQTAESAEKEVVPAFNKKTGRTVPTEIIYNEGELDNSDLSLPPSPSNPHPFDISTLPPTYSRHIFNYANHSPILRLLVDLKVCMDNPRLAKFLLKLQLPEVQEKVNYLMELGFSQDELGSYLTRNPYYLLQELDVMKERVKYLVNKQFKKDEIHKVIKEYWINTDEKTLDARIGFMQHHLRINRHLARSIVVKEPRIIMFGIGPMYRLVNLLTKELDFTRDQLRAMIVKDPRIFIQDSRSIAKNFFYCHYAMKLSHETISQHPFLLRASLSVVRLRYEFLKKLGRSLEGVDKKKAEGESTSVPGSTQSNDTRTEREEKLVKIEDFLRPSDAEFAIHAARTYPVIYSRFLRTH